MSTCLQCGMPEPHHAEWCGTRPSATGKKQSAGLFKWTLALFFLTSTLAYIGMLGEPWAGAGGGNPLLIFGVPGIIGGIMASEMGMPTIIVFVVAALFQAAVCLPCAWLLHRFWSKFRS